MPTHTEQERQGPSPFRQQLVDVVETLSARVAGRPGGPALPSWRGIPDGPGEPQFNVDGDPAEAAGGGGGGGSWTPATSGSLAWGGHENGRIPTSQMVSVARGHRLEQSAADAWQEMVAAARADGVAISLTDSYRDFDAQVKVRKEKGHLVATAKPGTSNHGWGRAVDINVNEGQVLAWLRENGQRFGWHNPAWAQKAGKSYEPWHWEFAPGTPTQPKATPTPAAPEAPTVPTPAQTGRDADGRNFEE